MLPLTREVEQDSAGTKWAQKPHLGKVPTVEVAIVVEGATAGVVRGCLLVLFR